LVDPQTSIRPKTVVSEIPFRNTLMRTPGSER